MADMRQIFTYPTGLTTDYIDPSYWGNTTSGLTRRIDELLTGTYKAWLNPLSITATTSEVMQNISKFGSYYENQSYAGHLSRYDFWNKPLVVATKKLIDSETIQSAALDPGFSPGGPMLVTTTTDHEFEDGMKLATTNVNGSWGSLITAGQVPNMFADVQSSTTFRVATEKDENTGALSGYINVNGSVTNFMISSDKFYPGGKTLNEIDQGAGPNAVPSQQVAPYNTIPYTSWSRHSGIVCVDLSELAADSSTPLNLSDGTLITFNWNYQDNDWLNTKTFAIQNTEDTILGNDYIYPLFHNRTYDSNGVLQDADMFIINSNRFDLAYPLTTAPNFDAGRNYTNGSGLYIDGKISHLLTIPELWADYVPNSYPAMFDVRLPIVSPTTPVTLEPHERYVTVSKMYMRTFSDGRQNFGYPDYDPATDSLVATTHNSPNSVNYPYNRHGTVDVFTLDPVPGIPGRHTLSYSSGIPMDFMPRGGNVVNNLEISFYPMPQLASTKPWAQVTNARIKWPKPSALSISDGDPTNIDGGWQFQGEFSNNPYYLKNVSSLETSTYRIFDVYTDSALTIIYGSSFYGDPTNNLSSYYAEGSGAGGAGTNRFSQIRINANNPYTTAKLKSNADYSGWGITSGDQIDAFWDGTEWVVTSHTAATRTFNKRDSGIIQENAPSELDTALISAGDPLQPRFWIPVSGNEDLINSTNGNVIAWDRTVNPTVNDHINSQALNTLTDLGVFGQASGSLVQNTHKLFQSSTITYDTIAQAYPLPSGLEGFNPNIIDNNINVIHLQNPPAIVSGLTRPYPKVLVHNIPTTLPAQNSGSEYHNSFGSTPAVPTAYTTTGGMYIKEITGHNDYWECFSDFACTVPVFDTTSRTPTGPTASVEPTQGNYPFRIDLTGTDVLWTVDEINWQNSQSGTLIMSNAVNGATTLSQTVYIKSLGPNVYGRNEVEFYFDAALTNPYTSSAFTTDWAPFINSGGDGKLQFLTIEPPSQTPTSFSVPPNHQFGFGLQVVHVDEITSATRQTNSQDVFDFDSFAPDEGSAAEGMSIMYDGDGNETTSFSTLKFDWIKLFPNIDMTLPQVDSTQGQVGPFGADDNPYEIDTVSLLLPGNETFTYQTGASTTAPGGKVNTSKYWKAGTTTPSYYTNGTTSATFNTTVDTNGYLQSVTLTEEPDAEGRYPDGEDIALFIEALPDTYTAPVLTTAEQADIYDTHDEWTTDGYNALKFWPSHISPTSANILYNAPTIVNNSQSGLKYTRSSAHTKWILEVEYPPMSAEDFQKFHAVAQAGHGQSTPFMFNLRNKDGVSILWADMMDTNSSLSGSAITQSAIGDTVLFLEGLTASDPEAFRQGEVFLSSENENGKLHTSIGAAASNAFGEAKVRMPWPLRAAVAQTDLVYKNPGNCVVTLNSDQFEYSVDEHNYYTVTVAFDLDNWK